MGAITMRFAKVSGPTCAGVKSLVRMIHLQIPADSPTARGPVTMR